MSALHRLKAYFGMVPAEDFDSAEFGPGEFSPEEFGAAEFDDCRADYRSGRSGPSYGSSGHGNPHDHAVPRPGAHRSYQAASEGYDDGFAIPAGPRVHPTRPPSWSSESWTKKAPVRGSLAIDTASTLRSPTSPYLASHQPGVSQHFPPMSSTGSVAEEPLVEDGAHPLGRIVTLHPHNYNEARPIGERYREGNPVIMNLTEMQDRDAKRLVDFAAGLAFALRGSIDKITNKVFLLSPPNVDVSPEDRRRIAEGRFFG